MLNFKIIGTAYFIKKSQQVNELKHNTWNSIVWPKYTYFGLYNTLKKGYLKNRDIITEIFQKLEFVSV